MERKKSVSFFPPFLFVHVCLEIIFSQPFSAPMVRESDKFALLRHLKKLRHYKIRFLNNSNNSIDALLGKPRRIFDS